MQTKIEEATSERVKAQHNLDHWRQKLQEEANKLANLEQAAAVLQEEYEVRTNITLLDSVLITVRLAFRIGQRKQKIIVMA